MVVNWTGGLPDRPGFWLMLRVGREEGGLTSEFKPCEPTPVLIDVCLRGDTLYTEYDEFDDFFDTVEELFKWEYDHGHVKFATQPIQFENVDWDYKYKANDE